MVLSYDHSTLPGMGSGKRGGTAGCASIPIPADPAAERVMSLASVMGPPDCHDLGTTRAA
jgi:hypothetical protein